MNLESLKSRDKAAYEIAVSEGRRTEEEISLIASENYASQAVLETLSTTLANKVSEGLPGRRFHAGNRVIDEAENLAIERVKRLYEVEYANVQPHSGALANLSAYLAFLKPRDKILCLSLDQGGHLTHGSPANCSGFFYQPSFYSLNENEQIDYDGLRSKALKEKPKIIVAGFSAYPRQLDFKRLAEIADETGTGLMVDMAHIAGLVAAGVHNSPVGYADVITSSTYKTLRGPRGGFILSSSEYAKAIDSAVFPGLQSTPEENSILAKAVCFQEARQEDFKQYGRQVVKNAKVMADELQSRGYRLVSGGTDTHLLLIDLTDKKITGLEAERLLEKAGINTNRNEIPNETRGPWVTSGLRLGTAALTTRGMKENECREIIAYIDDILSNKRKPEDTRSQIKKMAEAFPVYLRP